MGGVHAALRTVDMRSRCFVIFVCGVLTGLTSAPASGEDKLIWKDGKWVKEVPAEGSAAGELAIIRRHVEQRQETKAIDAVKKFLQRYPDDAGREEALMLAGQAEMNRDRYYQAYEWFEQQLASFPSGQYYERALQREYEIGDAFLNGKKRIAMTVLRLPAESEGLEILSRVAEHAPGTAIAEKALLRVGEHHFSLKNYADAVQAYDQYRAMFPKSDKTSYAMLRSARAMLASYRGSEFDEKPLIDAEQMFKELAQRYPMTADQEGVGETLRAIRAARAHRVYTTGQFYERTKHPSAAAYYYKLVVQSYGDTDWSAKARGDLARLGVRTIQPGEASAQPVMKSSFATTRPQRPDTPGNLKAPASTTQEGKVRQ